MGSTEYEIWRDQQRDVATTKPVRGVVSGYVPERELLKCEMFGTSGQAEIAVRQPYLGVNSWIRVGPEVGSSVITQRRGDVAQSEIWGYLSNRSADLIKRARTNPKIAYRVVQSGEIELMSQGMASLFLSNAGDVELWGGTVSEILSQTELEHRVTAPTFSRRLATNSWSVVGNEERFGMVKRPSKRFPELQQDYVRLSDNSFACEYSRWVGDTANTKLCQTQEGHVVDETGTVKKQTSTSKNLRLEHVLWNKGASADFTFQVDEDLNIFMNNGNPNRLEAKLQWGTLCDVTMTSNKLTMTMVDTVQITSATSLILGATTAIQLGAPSIVFGPSTAAASAAAQPSVLGTNLNSNILTPLFTALIAWFQTFGADPIAVLTLPVEAAAATTLAAVLTSVSAQLPTILSQSLKLSL